MVGIIIIALCTLNSNELSEYPWVTTAAMTTAIIHIPTIKYFFPNINERRERITMSIIEDIAEVVKGLTLFPFIKYLSALSSSVEMFIVLCGLLKRRISFLINKEEILIIVVAIMPIPKVSL